MHAINADKLLPKAQEQPPPKGHKGVKVGNGVTVRHGGFATTDVKVEEGNHREIRWHNAEVVMHSLSTKELNRENGRLIYDENEGWIMNKLTGDSNHFISAAGVYFCKLYLPKKLFGSDIPSAVFGRPG